MREKYDNVIDFWNNHATPEACHISGYKSRDRLYEMYELFMIPGFVHFEGKTIVNYGCGGGQLERLLHEKYGIKKSISIDIAERSIEAAKHYLKDYNSEFVLCDTDCMQFVSGKDEKYIFMSCECIHHFPDQNYLDEWLDCLNSQDYEWVILYYKPRKKGVRFDSKSYDDFDCKKISRACSVSTEYMAEKLERYDLVEVRKNYRGRSREAGYWRLK
jgi:SAM-dependent methyltransferase